MALTDLSEPPVNWSGVGTNRALRLDSQTFAPLGLIRPHGTFVQEDVSTRPCCHW
jgi:hypothetical protein